MSHTKVVALSFLPSKTDRIRTEDHYYTEFDKKGKNLTKNSVKFVDILKVGKLQAVVA